MSDDVSSGDLRTALTLVASEMGRLTGKVDESISKLHDIEVRQEGTRVELAGINRRLDVGNERMDVANGRMTKAEMRLEAIEDAQRVAEAEQRGRRAQRDDDIERIRTVKDLVTDFWPLAFGAILGGIGVGSFLWGILR